MTRPTTRPTTRALLALALACPLAACQKDAPPPAAPSAAPAAAPLTPPTGSLHAEGLHGAPGAVPGSHEDWCGEHGVPESQCTRCNAKLIPAFKATGDWCDDHGLPRSQCKNCDPTLKIERPPKQG